MRSLNKTLEIAAVVLVLTGCDGQRSPIVNKTSVDNFKATATTTYRHSMGENFPSTQHLDFSATKKGAYLIEGWKSVYRYNDDLDKIVSFKVAKLPFEKKIDFSKDVYRVEITYSNGSVIERSTVRFPINNNYY